MAPEIIQQDAYGGSADVYSFGIVMWEIAAQTTPWQEVPLKRLLVDFMKDLHRRIVSEHRPPISADWPVAFCKVGKCYLDRCALAGKC